jgi:glycosyltransferase involved in cell wall biosynthesis
MKNDILVSVCMITYNHEKFISEAIEGVLMQKTNFLIELIIGEDCSTDNTCKICLEYKEKYPDIIQLQLPETNRGMMRNFIETMQAAQGKYIALCEGDDYWTDPNKLQRQVDFLEENEDFSLCFHEVKILKGSEFVNDYITRKVPDSTDIYELAQGNYIHTPSVMFRKNEDVFKILAALGDLPAGDYVLHMLNAQYGKIKKLPEMMAVYRAGVGIWSSKDSQYRISNSLNMLNKLIGLFADNKKLILILKKQYRMLSFVLYKIYENEKDTYNARTCFIAICENYPDWVYDEYNERICELNSIKYSKAYRLGKFILNPVLYIRNKIAGK